MHWPWIWVSILRRYVHSCLCKNHRKGRMIDRLCQLVSRRDCKRLWIDNAKPPLSCWGLLSYIVLLLVLINYKGLLGEGNQHLASLFPWRKWIPQPLVILGQNKGEARQGGAQNLILGFRLAETAPEHSDLERWARFCNVMKGWALVKESLYSCSRVSETKYHKLGGLKQQRLVASHFWRPEIQKEALAEPYPLYKPLGANLPCRFLASSDDLRSLAFPGWQLQHLLSAFICTWHSPPCLCFHMAFSFLHLSLTRKPVMLDKESISRLYHLILTDQLITHPP